MADQATESDLERAMLEYWKETCRLGYQAGRFYQMFMPHCKHYIGGIRTICHLIRNSPTAGFEFVLKHHRSDLAMENLVLEKRFSHLFTDEDRSVAERTLAKYSG